MPACKAPHSVRAAELRIWGWPLLLFGLHPFRCLACTKRFHRRWDNSPEAPSHVVVVSTAPAIKPVAIPEEPSVPRDWTFPALPYSLKSFAVLLLLHFLIGGLEFGPLGQAAMWVNMLSLVTLVGAVLVLIDLYRVRPASSEAAGHTLALVLQWEGLFLALESLYGFFFGPGGPGLSALIELVRQQSPWIWMTYALLPISGALGCSAYLLFGKRRET